MALFRRRKVYTDAYIDGDMLVMTRRTRFSFSHSEMRVVIPNISSMQVSTIFGLKSRIFLFLGILLLIMGVGSIFSVPSSSVLIAAPIMIILGVILIFVAFMIRECALSVNCCGDFHDICVGRMSCDELFKEICKVIKRF